MRTFALGALTGTLLAALAGPATAQDAKPGFTVSFSGELRVLGYSCLRQHHGLRGHRNFNRPFHPPDPVGDRPDLDGCPVLWPRCKDSAALYFQRWRLFTTVESADLKARVVWGVEVGDVDWGGRRRLPPGTSTAAGTNNRGAGQSQGAGLGADGVNIETKNLYLQFELPWVPGLSLLLGAAQHPDPRLAGRGLSGRRRLRHPARLAAGAGRRAALDGEGRRERARERGRQYLLRGAGGGWT